MGYIYRIYNKESGKSYIGQTAYSVERRFLQHIYNAHTQTSHSYNQHLKRAIRKYGVDAFDIEVVEECDGAMLNEREKYWIQQYDSLKHGYNMTHGGEGVVKHDVDEIMQEWRKGLIVSEISKKFNMCDACVSKNLRKGGVTDEEINERRYKSAGDRRRKPVYQYDLDGNYIREYASISYVPSLRSSNLCVALKRGTACGGYLWSYEKVDRMPPHKNHRHRAVHQYSLDGDYIASYNSVVEASEAIGHRATTISDSIYGRVKQCGGYLWSHDKVDKLTIQQGV